MSRLGIRLLFGTHCANELTLRHSTRWVPKRSRIPIHLFRIGSNYPKSECVNYRFLHLIFAFTVLTGFVSDASAKKKSFPIPERRTYGREINFSNDELYRAFLARKPKEESTDDSWQRPDENEAGWAKKYADKIEELCKPDCIKTEHEGKFGHTEFSFDFPKEKWGFNISVDPGVVEIQTRPETLKSIQKNESLLQKYVFDVAQSKRVGLKTLRTTASGGISRFSNHFNIGAKSAFGDDAEALMRFYTDYARRPALGLGLLGRDGYNAPLVSQLKNEQRKELTQLVNETNQLKLHSLYGAGTKLNTKVHYDSPDFGTVSKSKHYQAINVQNLNQLHPTLGSGTDVSFELRAIFQEGSAKSMTLTAELMDKRITYNNAQTGPIIYLNRALEPWEGDVMNQAVHAYILTSEIGADWKRYAPLFPISVNDVLRTGKIQKVFAGPIDWKDPEAVTIFKRYLVRDFSLSPWMKERTIQALNDPKIPEDMLQFAFESMRKDALESPALALQLKDVIKEAKKFQSVQDSPSVKEFLEQTDEELNEKALKRKIGRPNAIQRCLQGMKEVLNATFNVLEI